MGALKISKAKSKREYSVSYTNMHGVDFSGDGGGISRNRFAYLENMYKDYLGDGGGAIESIPGFRRLKRLIGKTKGIYSLKGKDGAELIIFHTGSHLYSVPLASIDDEDSFVHLSSVSKVSSAAIRLGEGLLFLDGENIYYITPEGAIKPILDGFELSGYVPTAFVNGKPYEQLNMLTDFFKEKHFIGNTGTYTHYSDGLKFEITDAEKKTCRILGIDGDATDVYIPSYMPVGNDFYQVTEIAYEAFSENASIERVKVAQGVNYIGKYAFYKCPALVSVILPDSITHIDALAFGECPVLSELHLGRGVERVGMSLVAGCVSLVTVTYSGTEEQFALIENNSVLGSKTIRHSVTRSEIKIRIPINSPAKEITSLTVSGVSHDFECFTEGGIVKYITADFSSTSEVAAAELVVLGVLSTLAKDFSAIGGFMKSEFAEGGKRSDIIRKCRVAQSFDGRIFFSGNPAYPGIVFYTSPNTNEKNGILHFGDFNYFCDGNGSFNVISMLSFSDGIAVFKEDDDGGSIFYHTPRETGDELVPKIYPTSYIHSGICASSAAISFFDDPVFLCKRGLCGIDKRNISLDRSIAVRSHNVNPRLLSEDLKSASLAVWQGYLVVAIGPHIYLADSRDVFTHETGNVEYEWYYLSGIGTYEGDSTVFRYSSIAPEGQECNILHLDEIADGTVYNVVVNSQITQYVEKNGIKYAVYPTEERTGGSFSPLCAVHSVDDYLFFGTENGDVCVFNSDRRGVPCDSDRLSEDFDEIAYREKFGRRIHPSNYSFEKHPPLYALKTAYDNCNLPYLSKSTSKGSLAIKCRAYPGSKIMCEVGTDSSDYKELCKIPGTALGFSDIDFGAMTLSTSDTFTVSVSEKEKDWVEKQITLYSSEYNSPIGIYSVAYRFKVKGKLKNK